MTVNYKADSAVELRKFLWHELTAENIFDEAEYYSDSLGMTIIPIIPVQQSPELNQFLSGKKHMVYDKISSSYDTMWFICEEQVMFTVYSTEMSEINEIRNFMIDLFRRMDESARDMNRWSSISNLFKFHSIYVADISPTEPSAELKGFLSTDIVLDIKYSRVHGIDGRYL